MKKIVIAVLLVLGCAGNPEDKCKPIASTDECTIEGESCLTPFEGSQGTCHGSCQTPMHCCSGCWNGIECMPGFTNEACGWGGEKCDECSAGEHCMYICTK